MRPWRSGVFWLALVVAWLATGLPPTVPVYKGARVIGWIPLYLTYPLFLWQFITLHLGITTLLALAIWGTYVLARRLVKDGSRGLAD